MNTRKIHTKKITGIAILLALEVGFCFITNYVSFGQVNINIALIPIILGACIYGPIVGCSLGLVNGAITIIAPSTLAVFFPYNPIATIFLCLIKTSVAGLVSGFIFKAIKNKKIGSVVASALVPLINTLIFILGVFAFFTDIYASANLNGMNVFLFVVVSVVSINFAIEIGTCIILCPTIYAVLSKMIEKYKK